MPYVYCVGESTRSDYHLYNVFMPALTSVLQHEIVRVSA